MPFGDCWIPKNEASAEPLLSARLEKGIEFNSMTLHFAYNGYHFGAILPLSHHHMGNLVEIFQLPDLAPTSALGGRRPVSKLHLYSIGTVIIKHFRRGGLLSHLIDRTYFGMWKTRGQLEFEQMQRARQLGVQTPEPIAYAYKGRIFYQAWLVTREIPSTQSMAQLSRTEPHRVASAFQSLGRQVSILIDHSILHADFHPGNVLVDIRDQVYLVDFDKTTTYGGSKLLLVSRYRQRWCRAVRKHGLPEMLCQGILECLS
jgi:serine/threonine protein kinase